MGRVSGIRPDVSFDIIPYPGLLQPIEVLMRTHRAYAAVLALASLGSCGLMQEGHHVIARPEDTTWGPASPKLPPGAQFAVLAGDPSRPGHPYVFRVRLPDGYSVPPHSHPMDENVTVIQGVFRLGFGTRFDRGAMHELTAGAYAMLPEGLAHYNEVKGETILQFHGLGPYDVTYVNAADDPSRTSSGEGIDRASPTDEEVLVTEPLIYRRGAPVR